MTALTDVIKTLVDGETADLWRRRANVAGCSSSDLLRDAIYQIIHGKTYGEHVADLRRIALESTDPNSFRSSTAIVPQAKALRSVNDD